jgi:lipopolysaccharide transport system ATP-binding protein
MSSDIAIKVDNLSKCFHIYDKPRDRLLQMLSRGRRTYFREFWALHGISFEVKRGETVGIVGRNGSGKSTLLQIVCGTLTPTQGEVQTNGRIAALLELGSGFNPEFTGRENVYLNAAVLGLSREEIDEVFDSIAAFADIGAFLEQPVKSYSSGMALRLAFAVQAQVSPDILIVDEALAVGDARFQAKCFERLRQLKDNGTSILLVTHSSEQVVTHCSRALLVDSGNLHMAGEPRAVMNRYMDLLFGREKQTDGQLLISHDGNGEANDIENALLPASPEPIGFGLSVCEDVYSSRPHYNSHEYRWGDGAATILDYRLLADGREVAHSVESGAAVTLDVAIRFNQLIVNPIFGFNVKTKEGVTVCGTNSYLLECQEFHSKGEPGSVAVMRLRFDSRLAGGDYFLSLGVASRQAEEIVPHDRRYDSIHLVIAPTEQLYGLVDLSVSFNVNQVSKNDPT